MIDPGQAEVSEHRLRLVLGNSEVPRTALVRLKKGSLQFFLDRACVQDAKPKADCPNTARRRTDKTDKAGPWNALARHLVHQCNKEI
ncbi:MAG TPA: hypothetical protein VMV69_17830 [Pirellulales bacterium]|nr:hypothetical protein [Pirellulales bacterium]